MKIRKIIRYVLIMIAAIFGCAFGLVLIEWIVVEIVMAVNPHDFDTGCACEGKILNLFFLVSADTGYLPEPSDFSFCFGAFIGLIIGGSLIYRQSKR